MQRWLLQRRQIWLNLGRTDLVTLLRREIQLPFPLHHRAMAQLSAHETNAARVGCRGGQGKTGDTSNLNFAFELEVKVSRTTAAYKGFAQVRSLNKEFLANGVSVCETEREDENLGASRPPSYRKRVLLFVLYICTALDTGRFVPEISQPHAHNFTAPHNSNPHLRYVERHFPDRQERLRQLQDLGLDRHRCRRNRRLAQHNRRVANASGRTGRGGGGG